MSRTSKRLILRQYTDVAEYVEDTLAEEQCLSICINGQEVGRTMCTPGHDEQLVLGYLHSEGLIKSAASVAALTFSSFSKGGLQAEVTLAENAVSLKNATLRPGEVPFLTTTEIFGFMKAMESAQDVFRRTGATHCSAIYTAGGRQLAMAEDIGRHNALDKVIGIALQQNTLDQAIAITMSSRLSCDLVNKAAAAGVSYLCGISVATGLAVETAEQHGITLIGRVRQGRMNVYTCKERVTRPTKEQQEAIPQSSAS